MCTFNCLILIENLKLKIVIFNGSRKYAYI